MSKHTAVAMTKEQLADKILKVITPLVDEFVKQPSPEAQAAQAEWAKLENQKQLVAKALGAESVGYKGAAKEVESAQSRLDIDDSNGERNNRHHAAWAVTHACNALKLPVAMKQASVKASAAGNGKPTGKGRRLTPSELDEAAEAVFRVLPPKNTTDDKCWHKEAISAETRLDLKVVDSALAKLKREGQAVSNGIRGIRGGWRRA